MAIPLGRLLLADGVSTNPPARKRQPQRPSMSIGYQGMWSPVTELMCLVRPLPGCAARFAAPQTIPTVQL